MILKTTPVDLRPTRTTSLATTTQFTSVRVVCNNALAIALGNNTGAVKVSHRSDGPAVKRQRGIAISLGDCADVLRPIWLSKAETASRTRQRTHAIMHWAWADGHITANPVTVVDHILAKQSGKHEHQPAMPWRQVPKFVATHLGEQGARYSSHAALLFLILTAAPSGEVPGAVWNEFDLQTGTWSIPADRMKAKEPHRSLSESSGEPTTGSVVRTCPSIAPGSQAYAETR